MEDYRPLLAAIRNATSATQVLRLLEKHGKLTPLNEYLAHAMATANVTPQELAVLIDVERSTLYRLLSGERLTSRNVLLRIALALRFTLAETQTLLLVGERAQLFQIQPRDSLIIFSIEHQYTLKETDDTLKRKNMPDLYERM